MNQAMIAMALTLVVYYLVPKYVTKPTNIKVVDDMVMGINATQDIVASMILLVGLLTMGGIYIDNQYVK